MQSSPPQEGIVPMGATLEIQRQQQMEILEQQVWLSRAREARDRASQQVYFREPNPLKRS